MTDLSTGAGAAYGDRDPDALARRAGERANPDRDQHFLVDDRVLDRIPGYLPDDADTSHLLEIGGGAGALTDRLLAAITSSADTDTAPAPGHLSVIERDGTFADFLREEFATAIDDGLLDVIEGDALDVDLPDFTACVANLPYGVSSEIAFRLLPEGKPLVLMFQAEFAERMVASAGESEYGRLSVSAQHYAAVEIVERVPKEAFDPSPRSRAPSSGVSPRSRLRGGRRGVLPPVREGTVHPAAQDGPERDPEHRPHLRARRPGSRRRRRRRGPAPPATGHLEPSSFAALAELAREHGSPTEV